MWFPDDVWGEICSFLFPIWGRNPWLKKYEKVVASIPTNTPYSQPQRIIKSYPRFKFTIYLERMGWSGEAVRHSHAYHSILKIYTMDNI